jgi:hexosaminidase
LPLRKNTIMTIRMILLLVTVSTIIACNTKEEAPTDLTQDVLIPKPVSVTSAGGTFELNNESAVYVEGESPELLKIARYLSGILSPATGFEFKVSSSTGVPSAKNHVYLNASGNDPQLGDEGYELTINDNSIQVNANKPAGVFWAVQTILQLLPDSIELRSKQEGPWKIATGKIRDYPSYAFRGAMLDVSRHFFGVDDVKRYIDLISFYKMNVLHLHLSDDQGWRIEIKSWPNLTTHGGSTQVGGGKGGFYTQDQYKDIVQYAQDRYITIIPEIDMPGHTNAALASYPELNCNGKAPALYTGTEVGFSTFCAGKDITYKFIDDVVRELSEITPGPYIHLGGDESHATKKNDYILFVNKVQPIAKKYGKRMIGWEEIAQSNLDSSTIVQHWSNPDYPKEAVRKGAKIIMSPAKKVYLDMKYDSSTRIGLQWAARIEIDSSYIWSPSSRVDGVPRENILGLEAPLWTETITTMDDIEYMVFPRLPGIAEIAWSPENGRSWEEYKLRLGKHGRRMKMKEIDFYKSKQVSWLK